MQGCVGVRYIALLSGVQVIVVFLRQLLRCLRVAFAASISKPSELGSDVGKSISHLRHDYLHNDGNTERKPHRLMPANSEVFEVAVEEWQGVKSSRQAWMTFEAGNLVVDQHDDHGDIYVLSD